MPADAHHRDEVPLFDLVMGQPVPTLSTLASPGTTAAGLPNGQGLADMIGRAARGTDPAAPVVVRLIGRRGDVRAEYVADRATQTIDGRLVIDIRPAD